MWTQKHRWYNFFSLFHTRTHKHTSKITLTNSYVEWRSPIGCSKFLISLSYPRSKKRCSCLLSFSCPFVGFSFLFSLSLFRPVFRRHPSSSPTLICCFGGAVSFSFVLPFHTSVSVKQTSLERTSVGTNDWIYFCFSVKPCLWREFFRQGRFSVKWKACAIRKRGGQSTCCGGVFVTSQSMTTIVSFHYTVVITAHLRLLLLNVFTFSIDSRIRATWRSRWSESSKFRSKGLRNSRVDGVIHEGSFGHCVNKLPSWNLHDCL